jgi:hypothetical protein
MESKLLMEADNLNHLMLISTNGPVLIEFYPPKAVKH